MTEKLSRAGWVVLVILAAVNVAMVLEGVAPRSLAWCSLLLIALEVIKILVIAKRFEQKGSKSTRAAVVTAEGLTFGVAVLIVIGMVSAEEMSEKVVPLTYCADFVVCRAASCMVLSKNLWK